MPAVGRRSVAAGGSRADELRRYAELVSDAADGEEMAGAIAEDRAESALRELGYGFRELRSTVTDLDTMKINFKPASRR